MEKYLKKIKSTFFLQILFFVILILIDQITKMFAVNYLRSNGPVTVIKGFADFQYLENTGAAFGILENSMWFFYIITAVIFVVIVIVWLKNHSGLKTYVSDQYGSETFREKTFSDMNGLGYILAALAAGAIGNLIDRVINGYVVDFIRFTFVNFPIFNFADICVTISVILLCVFFIFINKEDPNYKVFKKKTSE